MSANDRDYFSTPHRASSSAHAHQPQPPHVSAQPGAAREEFEPPVMSSPNAAHETPSPGSDYGTVVPSNLKDFEESYSAFAILTPEEHREMEGEEQERDEGRGSESNASSQLGVTGAGARRGHASVSSYASGATSASGFVVTDTDEAPPSDPFGTPNSKAASLPSSAIQEVNAERQFRQAPVPHTVKSFSGLAGVYSSHSRPTTSDPDSGFVVSAAESQASVNSPGPVRNVRPSFSATFSSPAGGFPTLSHGRGGFASNASSVVATPSPLGNNGGYFRDSLSSPRLLASHASVPILRGAGGVATSQYPPTSDAGIRSTMGLLSPYTPGTPSTPGFGGMVSKKSSFMSVRAKSTALPELWYDEKKMSDDAADANGKKRKKWKKTTDPAKDSPIPKPWLARKEGRARASWWITFFMMCLGLVAAGALCFFGARSVKFVGNVCLVFEDDFSSAGSGDGGLDTSKWFREIELGGYGNGEFEMTTGSANNSFVQDGVLYLVPTLTADNLGDPNAIFDGRVFNLTGCTSSNLTSCSAVSNGTTHTVINPVQSARISTRVNGSVQSIGYGRIEIRARMPQGDWIWPAIWMLPVPAGAQDAAAYSRNQSIAYYLGEGGGGGNASAGLYPADVWGEDGGGVYGSWPMSGEIDIVEARGNGPEYPKQGDNYVRGSLNWGPNNFINSVWKTYGWWTMRRKTFAQDFHTYTLEWTDQFLRVYVDNRLQRMLDLSFAKESFFKRGDYPATAWNGTQEISITNPWDGRGNSAPFDQPFYLIMNVAVGGTNGWFPDGAGNKPWLDGSLDAMYNFAKAQDQWYPTWPTDLQQRALAIDSVRMWQKC